ncbi:MAG TPA: winged helix-turn-helix domain-containing protein [Anaerolineae bacterium]|nr:winged helix-turn-helix domain-containing protein [Anaerolineae bacterium]
MESTVNFGLEPAFNVLHSLMLLAKVDHYSGLDEWVMQTATSLPPDRRYMNNVVLIGVHYAVIPARSWSSFPLYLDDLARQDPIALRDRVFNAYFSIGKAKGGSTEGLMKPAISDMLADQALYFAFLRERFGSFDEEVEAEAHLLLNDPPKLRETIVSHLRYMWTHVMAPEWERVSPMLQACVDAYRQLDFSGKSIVEAIQQVVEQKPDDWCQKVAGETQRVVFVPSAHVGPYQGRYVANDTLYLIFGARHPQGVVSLSPELSRSELVVRVSALADDTRLRILHFIAQNGEQRSPDIIRRLDLSQSATSRHLQQLSATGYLTERWHEGSKWYSLNLDRLDDTFRALSRFLQTKSN